jgi:predicted CopG family antitoxin
MIIKKRSKVKHIIVSDENFEELRKYGYANDSMNDVITRILKSIRLELGSRVGGLTKL